MNRKFDRQTTEVVYSNPYWDYKKDKYILPNYKSGDYHYIETKGSIMIIPILFDKLVLTEQFRYLNQKNSIEFPGGGLKKELSIEENLQKELSEESGYKAGKFKKIGEFNPFNGVTNEICNVYLAWDLEEKKSVQDETEEIKVKLFTFKEFESLILKGLIWDGMTLSAWAIFKYSIYFDKFFVEK